MHSLLVRTVAIGALVFGFQILLLAAVAWIVVSAIRAARTRKTGFEALRRQLGAPVGTGDVRVERGGSTFLVRLHPGIRGQPWWLAVAMVLGPPRGHAGDIRLADSELEITAPRSGLVAKGTWPDATRDRVLREGRAPIDALFALGARDVRYVSMSGELSAGIRDPKAEHFDAARVEHVMAALAALAATLRACA